VDQITGGILVFFVCLLAVIILGVGFAVAVGRGARKARREQPG
jgi:hypothetical protein